MDARARPAAASSWPMSFSVPPSVPQPNASTPAAPTPSWSPANIPRCRTTSAPAPSATCPSCSTSPSPTAPPACVPAAELCAQRGVFSALTLPNRGTELVDLVQQMIDDGSLGDLVLYNSRLNNGPPSRYDPTPSAWHNDATVSGGGCWANRVRPRHRHLSAVRRRPARHRCRRCHLQLDVRTRSRGCRRGYIAHGQRCDRYRRIRLQLPIRRARGGDHSFRFIGTKATVLQRYDQQGNRVTEVHTT